MFRMHGCRGVWRIAVMAVWGIGSFLVQVHSAERLAKTRHATVELIAAGEVPDANGCLWIGISFHLEPGWHIYWRNPGDSGQPPSAQWQLPVGVHAGAFEWPVPERIPLDPLVNYGYRDDVVFPLRLVREQELPAGGLKIGATLKWLICHDVCIPERAGLQLTLPLADPGRKVLPGWRRRIEEARNRVPRPLPAAWKATATSHEESFSVSLSMDRPAPVKAIFFPVDAGQIDDSSPQDVKASGRDLTLTLRKSDQLSDRPGVLRLVLSLPTGEAFAVDAPVLPQEGTTSTKRIK